MASERKSYQDLLDHALPPPARDPRYERSFSDTYRNDLHKLWGCTDKQIDRLQRILPAIAYYDEQGPALADVRKLLVQIAKYTDRVAGDMSALLKAPEEAPEYDRTRDEARMRLLQAISKLYPERCEVDPSRVSRWQSYDPCMEEAQRLLTTLQDVAKAAKHAHTQCKQQTRVVAHTYPITLINAALNVDGPPIIRVSESGPFFEIAYICYQAVGVQGEPRVAIRKYLHLLNARS